LTYVAAYPSAGIWTAPDWAVTNIDPGQTEVLTLEVLVGADTSGQTLTNTVSHVQDQDDSNTTLDDLEATIVVTSADIGVTKTVDNSSPLELANINYTISVSNTGPNTATGVSITDLLPSELMYISDNSGGAYNSGSGLWTIGTLADGQTKELLITASVRINTVGITITNTTSNLIADQGDLNPSNNVASVSIVPVREVDLSLTKEFVDGTDVPWIANLKMFEIKVTNEGVSIATGVEVTDLLPSGYSFVGYSSTVGAYNYVSGIWDIGQILPGTVVVLTIDVIVLGTGDYENCAEITAINETDIDSTPGNGDPTEDDYACAGITYGTDLDLGVEKTVLNNELTPNVGTQITFKIELTNHGLLDAYSVQLRDIIPTGYQYVNYSASSGVYNEATGIWSLSSIAKQSTEELLVTVLVNSIGDYENCVNIIESSNSDSNALNDTSCITVVPIAIVDLELDKRVSDNKPTSGDEIEFTIRLINKGPSLATGVQVLDNLPSGYQFVSYYSTEGSFDEISGIWDVGMVYLGIEEELVIRVKVLSTGEWDNTAEVYTCIEVDIDSTPGNNNPDEDDQDTVEVDVIIDLFIPEEFTPNGDGINDTFEIDNLSVLYPNFKIVIVNRWGNKVFEYQHSGNPNTKPIWWDGYSGGAVNLGSGDVPVGTYFYTIEFNNNDRAPQTGWVYLRR
ncbi:gliding motility-associated C-terminal domain-containing protein, partial [Flavicella sp.]|uniref:T9SS type B sorting domain-containing protein n=1 Tax=Flavicella sp. TaxID=2957742 RepID=UPI003015E86E